jgi:hypothetical protein
MVASMALAMAARRAVRVGTTSLRPTTPASSISASHSAANSALAPTSNCLMRSAAASQSWAVRSS